MLISELCKMIEESIKSGRYPLETDTQKRLAALLQVTNKSGHEDMRSDGIQIEVRVQDLFMTGNYVPNIKHLPGMIEMDIVDSFKMICRKIDRIDTGINLKLK
jgi:hypothetical protein